MLERRHLLSRYAFTLEVNCTLRGWYVGV